MTTGQGARHLGSSLAPATDQSLSAGASCASSLPARAAVVTTRLAQRCCRLARTALQHESHWLAPLRLVGVMLPRVCHTRHAWLQTSLASQLLLLGAVERGCTPHECRRSSIAIAPRLPLGCGRTVAGARCQDAVQTIDYRLTGISEPCGCRCRGDQSGSCARSREHRAMRLRASSGLTQPALKTIRCPAIRCTMAKRYGAYSANRQTRGCDHRTIAQVPQKPTEGPRQILACRSAWKG